MNEVEYIFCKNIELYKKYKNTVPLEKRRQLKLLILVFQNHRRISFNILARMIDYYFVFTYPDIILRNTPRKRSGRHFVRNQE